MSTITLCLVSFSVSRKSYKLSIELDNKQKAILRRLNTCFANLNGPVDSLSGCFDLNQTYYETTTNLHTSYGFMDFVDLPLHDSVWITKMYLEKKLDISVAYVENYDTDKQSYQPHRTFPDWTNVEVNEIDDDERQIKFHKAINEVIENIENKLK